MVTEHQWLFGSIYHLTPAGILAEAERSVVSTARSDPRPRDASRRHVVLQEKLFEQRVYKRSLL